LIVGFARPDLQKKQKTGQNRGCSPGESKGLLIRSERGNSACRLKSLATVSVVRLRAHSCLVRTEQKKKT
jgi:hypothetical protein